MYYPPHRPQLTGIATESVDCGVRATQMGINWLSKGAVHISVKDIRAEMGDQDETNYAQWDEVIDALGGQTLGFSGEQTNVWTRARDHMNGGGAVIWALDYGVLRRAAPSKTGSLTFDGYHAVLTIGARKHTGVRQWRSFDSLLDGRYEGCPNGPVWLKATKVRDAAYAVGQKEAGKDKVYAVLLHRDPSVAGIEPGDLLPEGGITMADLLSDLIDAAASTTDPATKELLGADIDGLAALIGITANPEADESTPVAAGVTV